MALTDTAIRHGKPASNKPCTLTDEEGLLLQVPQRVRSAGISVSIGMTSNCVFPFVGQWVAYFTRPLRRQAREYIFQIGIRIMTIQSRRLDQTHDRSRAFAAA